jgi:hypothetical protein
VPLFILKTKMTETTMNEFLQQLHDLVPSFDVASIPRDATGVYASPVHIIAEMLNVTPSYIQKIINKICVNVNVNCTKMKVNVDGTEQRNIIMVGNAESITHSFGSKLVIWDNFPYLSYRVTVNSFTELI